MQDACNQPYDFVIMRLSVFNDGTSNHAPVTLMDSLPSRHWLIHISQR